MEEEPEEREEGAVVAVARIRLPICKCEHLKNDHCGGTAHCDKCACLKYKKLSGNSARFNNERTAGFDSRAERERYRELELLQQAGHITDLEPPHKRVLVSPDGWPEVWWAVDFQYRENGKWIAEEFKGAEDSLYRVKRSLFVGKYVLSGEAELRVSAKARNGSIVADQRFEKFKRKEGL